MKFNMQTKNGAVAGLLISTVFWGASFPIVKVALSDIDPFLFIIARFVIASIIVLAIIAIFKGSVRRLLNNRILWILGVTNAIGFAMEFFGLSLTTASKASLLVNINVVFVAIFAAVILKDRIGSRVKVGIMVGLVGVFLTTTGGQLSTLAYGSMLGDIIVFVGGIVWAYSNIYNKKAVMELKLTSMEVTESMTLITTIALLPLLPFSSLAFSPTPFSVSALLYVSLICTILGFYLYYKSLKTLTIVNAGIITLFEIVVSIAIANVFLGETLPPLGIVGGLLIGASILLVS
jgi:drug/metabolite transporter (DMT)-like permease